VHRGGRISMCMAFIGPVIAKDIIENNVPRCSTTFYY
jgi:hypothetical protein